MLLTLNLWCFWHDRKTIFTEWIWDHCILSTNKRQETNTKKICTYVNERAPSHTVWFLYVCVSLLAFLQHVVTHKACRVLSSSCPVLALGLFIYPSLSSTRLCVMCIKTKLEVKTCLKAASHYNTCSRVRQQRHKAVISDILLLLPIHLQKNLKAVYFHTEAMLDLLLLLCLSRNACWYFSDV